MQNRNKISITINLLFILLGLGLVGYGIYYYTKPLPGFLHIMSADKEGTISSKDAAELMTALSSSRPWDSTLAEHANTAERKAASEETTRALVTALFVFGGIVLVVFGGRRIAIGLKKKTGAE